MPVGKLPKPNFPNSPAGPTPPASSRPPRSRSSIAIIMKPTPKYSVGIDLGTTNSVIAYAPLAAPTDAPAPPKILAVPQLVAPSTVEPRDVLPSFTYLATDAEKSSGVFTLPFTPKGTAS